MTRPSLKEMIGALFRTPDAATQDADAFAAYVRARSSDLFGIIPPGLVLTIALWWPFDFWLYRDDVGIARGLATWRFAVVATLAAFFVVWRASAWVRERSVGALCAASIVCATVTNLLLADLGGAAHPFLYGDYVVPLVTLIVVVGPRARAALVALMMAACLVPAIAASPALVASPSFGNFASVFAATNVLAFAAGHIVFQLFRANFLQQRALARSAAELEERVAARTAELRDLAAHLSGVLETERARIARDIHDELGQALSAMRLEVELTARDLTATPPVRDALGRVAALVEATLATSRRILTDLRPRVLDDFGLVAAVEWLVGEFRARHRCRCELSIDADLDTDPARATAVFRILQECLNNVAKHAAATRVEVVLAQDGDLIRLSVNDDGRGIQNDGPRAGAMGLLGMRERAWEFDGRVTVTSGPGRGTTVDVEIPTSTMPRSMRAAEATQ